MRDWSREDFPELLGPKIRVMGRRGNSAGLLPKDLKFAMEMEVGIMTRKEPRFGNLDGIG